MNRKQRRKQGIKTKVPIYHYNQQVVDELVMETLAKEKRKLRQELMNTMFGLMFMSLHDEFDWFNNEKYGRKRISRLIDRFNSNYDAIDKGYLKLDDCNEWCKNEGFAVKITD